MIQKFKIKKGDTVRVLVGRCYGHQGSVGKVLRSEGRVVVSGVNLVVRNVKPSNEHPEGPYNKEVPIDISNVALVDPSTGKPGKVGFKLDASGKKVRYFKKSGFVLK